MDSHIAGDPALDSTRTLRARLPGEPAPNLGESIPDPPLRAGPRTAPPQAPAPRSKRRGVLLSGVTLVGLAVIVGGAFLASPYNKVVPVPAGVRLAAIHAETQAALLWHHIIPGSRQRATSGAERTASAAPAPVVHPPAPQLPAVALPQLLAPSAALAGVHPLAPPAVVVQPPYKPQPQGQELAEVVNLGQGLAQVPPAALPAKAAPAHPQPTAHHTTEASGGPAAAPSGPPVDTEPHLPVAVPMAASVPVTGAAAPSSVVAAVHSITPHPASVPAGAVLTPPLATAVHPAVASMASPENTGGTSGSGAARPTAAVQGLPVTSGDALNVAKTLQAAPMSSDQQVQVLELVTQLATLIRDEHTQIGDLQADLQKSDGATSSKLADFERRLALVEASTAMAAASAPLIPPAPPAASAGAAGTSQPSAVPVALSSARMALAGASSQAPSQAASPALPVPPVAAQAPSGPPKQYRVQAASPGLAMLAEVDLGGGDGAQLQVQVGDTIPGYGRVLSVQQQGTNWVVQTQNGTIQ